MSITSGIQGSAVIPVKINGVHKTITNPVSGFLLHQLAGFPDKLSGGGKTVEKTAETIEVQPGAEFTADYGAGRGIDAPHPVEAEKPAEAPKPKPQPVTEAAVVNPAPPASVATPAAPVVDKK